MRAAEQSGLRSALATAPAGAYDIEIVGPTDNNSLASVVDGATAAAARANHQLFELVVLAGNRWVDVDLGRLGPGAATLHEVIPCAHGCPLRQIEFVNDSDTLFSASVTITGLSTDEQPVSTVRVDAAHERRLAGQSRRRRAGTARARPPQGSASGLTVRLQD